MIGKRREYDAMALCEQQLWWYKILHSLTLRFIRTSTNKKNLDILDAGCGTGGLLLALQSAGYSQLQAFDLSPDAVAYARQKSGLEVRLASVSNVDGYAKQSFDVIICHDILCLLSPGEDQQALESLSPLLRPGGLLLMNLPALTAFSGTHDLAVGIQKRYSKAKIRSLAAGLFSVEKILYWPFLLSPLIFAIRQMQRLKKRLPLHELESDVKMPPTWLNRLFYAITSLENNFLPAKPWGSSLFVVMRKASF